jgi:hypothetical protein
VIQCFPSAKYCQFFRKFCKIIEFFPSVNSTIFTFLVEKLVKFSISHISKKKKEKKTDVITRGLGFETKEDEQTKSIVMKS